MTFIADMNAIYSMRDLKVARAQTFGLSNIWLLKVEGLTFIPIKVRLLLFKDIIFLIFEFVV